MLSIYGDLYIWSFELIIYNHDGRVVFGCRLISLKTTQAHTSPRHVQMHNLNMLHRKWKCLGTVCNRDRLEGGECTYHITIELAGTV